MTRGTHRWLGYAEERAPCGRRGLIGFYLKACWHEPPDRQPGLDDCLVSRPKPFVLVIWEPLATKAPAPPKCAPYCCYINAVIFYHAPYIVWPYPRLYVSNGRRRADSGPSFLQWDQVRTRLGWEDVVEFEGERFVIGGGSVVWAQRRWWMLHGARRQATRAAA
jgi:hypothetical protein